MFEQSITPIKMIFKKFFLIAYYKILIYLLVFCKVTYICPIPNDIPASISDQCLNRIPLITNIIVGNTANIIALFFDFVFK